MRVRRPVALVIAALLTLTAFGGGDPAEQGNPEAVLNVGMPNGPQTENHNPLLTSSAAASLGYRFMIYEPLVMTNEVKPAEEGKPWLATEWEWADNYKKVTFTVRDGVKWSDGTAMTAKDVAYTFTLLKDTPALNINAIPFKSVETEGSKVTLAFDVPQFVNQVKILRQVVVPEHIWSKFADPATETNKTPVGTGPYQLKTFTPQTTTLTLRDSYWQDLPKVKELRYTSYNDNNAQTTALANGSSEWSFVFIPNYKTVYVDKDPANHKIWFPPTLAIHGLFLNTELKPFDNPALRRAMSKVVNREDIFTQAEAGYFYPKLENVTGIPTPAGEAFIADEFKGKDFAVDVDAAKAELTAAGFTFNGNALVDPSGKPVKITLSNPSGWSDYITTLEILKDNLSQIGIEVTVDKANADTWTENVDTGQFEGAMHWTNSGATPYDLYASMMDGALYKPVGTGGVNGNWGRFKNEKATAALKSYANAEDESARTAALHELQRIMVEQMPVIPTGAANAGGAFSSKNWTGWPSADDQYAPAQPTLHNSLDIVLHLRPA